MPTRSGKFGGKILTARGQNILTQKLLQIFATPAIKLLHLQQLGSEEFKKPCR
jgi:hypothetical protein